MTAKTYARMFRAAHKCLELKYSGRREPKANMAAVLSLGKHIYVARNYYKTKPIMKLMSNGKKECAHAEVSLMSRFMGEDIYGEMLVVREARSGIALAKPCAYCQKFLREFFPNVDVYFTTKNGVERLVP